MASLDLFGLLSLAEDLKQGLSFPIRDLARIRVSNVCFGGRVRVLNKYCTRVSNNNFRLPIRVLNQCCGLKIMLQDRVRVSN